jgi:hypothetical protein
VIAVMWCSPSRAMDDLLVPAAGVRENPTERILACATI